MEGDEGERESGEKAWVEWDRGWGQESSSEAAGWAHR